MKRGLHRRRWGAYVLRMAKPPKDPKERKALRAKMRGKIALTGSQRKDLVMVEARRLAESGAYSGFNQVQQAIARKDRETGLVLRLWATAADCDAIDKLCNLCRAHKR